MLKINIFLVTHVLFLMLSSFFISAIVTLWCYPDLVWVGRSRLLYPHWLIMKNICCVLLNCFYKIGIVFLECLAHQVIKPCSIFGDRPKGGGVHYISLMIIGIFIFYISSWLAFPRCIFWRQCLGWLLYFLS